MNDASEPNRECMFEKIMDGKMVLNHAGNMIKTVWDKIPFHYAGIDIDERREVEKGGTTSIRKSEN